ncbi:excinuclease ABC, B subunit [Chloroherpeton thalassium ATCC 35110]|uniref:UvrABC system protein B n=1 Tax=Chloroherpeton thalassium (strain ATCC 35110 / GB-78) TaxID=517418 RepID=B3QZ09_CHLT3|nr:excinuclease ABC subunit UvrB [Chloroherpeton thalassium]ACF13702.1 excinuclease ABC, B subunit [Chloroherpeton thalassium ATCC 35110]
MRLDGSSGKFELSCPYSPAGDQPKAIKELTEGVLRGDKHQTLLGVTGSGKTFSISNVIANVNKPTLVISHNKTLAAQLYGEFKQFFPNNAVEYFISYYDFYQPEAYLPSTDKYIAKDFRINDEIDRLRLRATSAVLSGRKDVIIVSSVSCIYGLGSPDEWASQIIFLETGMEKSRRELLNELVSIHYTRNDVELVRGKFRVRGDIIDIVPAYEDYGVRIEFFGDEIDRLQLFEIKTGDVFEEVSDFAIYPAKQFVTMEENLHKGIKAIEKELASRLNVLRSEDKLVEAQRLEERTRYDIEMMKELGYCSGVENYSRHLSGRGEGEKPYCLLDYFIDNDYLVVIDESHVTLPQIRAMYAGDRSRKSILVEHGFRLPSALDNRPLKFEEFQAMTPQTIYVSATPGDYELQQSGGVVVEQIIRPTGLLDPSIDVRPVKNQIDDLLAEIRMRAKIGEKILTMTLTKRMSEDLQDYLEKVGVRSQYLHSEIKSLDRVQILRELRMGEFDVLVGVNLLREGLDLPEVSLVAILDADKEGFLRDKKSLLQISGRAARNSNGKVIFYADKMTESMRAVINETERRRAIQIAYNEANGIVPKTIHKSLEQVMTSTSVADAQRRQKRARMQVESGVENLLEEVIEKMTKEEKLAMIDQMTEEMVDAAERTDYEKAAYLRDEIRRLQNALNGQKS